MFFSEGTKGNEHTTNKVRTESYLRNKLQLMIMNKDMDFFDVNIFPQIDEWMYMKRLK